MNKQKIKNWFSGLSPHIILITLCAAWLLPTLGLLVTSFRPVQDINETGWWKILAAPKGEEEFKTYCGECHGNDGKLIAEADLSNPELVQKYRRSFTLIALLKKDIDGKPHMGEAKSNMKKSEGMAKAVIASPVIGIAAGIAIGAIAIKNRKKPEDK